MKNFKLITKTAIVGNLLLVAVIFCGCETTVKYDTTKDIIDGVAIKILTIDSCEYVCIGNGYGAWGSHKGNCKYCAERSKK